MKKKPRYHRLGEAAATGLVIFALVGCRQIASVPAQDAPQAALVVAAMSMPIPAPSPVLGASTLSGIATWYRWHAGEAAAGPLLRQALGSHWRGKTVTVCAGTCIRTKLTDWCLCSQGRRLIDLDARSFAKLAPLSAGVVHITVKIGESFGPIPTAPATDITP